MRIAAPHRQSGMVLLLAMVALLVLGLFATAAMTGARLELRMADNSASAGRARAAAQGMLEALREPAAVLAVAPAWQGSRCTDAQVCVDSQALQWPLAPSALGPDSWQWRASLERRRPVGNIVPLLRRDEQQVSSALAFTVRVVEARVEVDPGRYVSGSVALARGWAFLQAADQRGSVP